MTTIVDGLEFRVFFSPGPSSGPTFVLLHGIGTSHRYLDRLRYRLSAIGSVYAFDLPGFAGTRKPDGRLSVVDYALAIGHLLDRLRLTGCSVVGHSMGTQFAVELAAQRPDLVSHVTLLGPVVDPLHPTALDQAFALARDVAGESPLANLVVFIDYLKCGMRWYATELDPMLSYPMEERAAGIAQPVLVIRGARDPIAPRRWMLQLAAACRHGMAREVPGARHLVQFSAAETTAAHILHLHHAVQLPAPPRVSLVE